MAARIAPGERVLDLCCGSARSSVPSHRRAGRPVTGLDVSYAMLRRGLDHARDRGAAFDPVCGDGFRLPFRDGTFEVVTTAWGLRNLVPLPEAAREIARVLRPGGRLLVLDSVAPAGGAFGRLHAAYLRHVVPLLGRLSPDPAAYRYLAESIFDFGPPDLVAGRLAEAGFTDVTARTLFLGAVGLFEGRRPISLLPHAGGEAGVVQSVNGGPHPGRDATPHRAEAPAPEAPGSPIPGPGDLADARPARQETGR
jgi:demethylmenaquinone methyltransferase/2-methoxy-6-polyprenyl-1,4-benzoquinol methylase